MSPFSRAIHEFCTMVMNPLGRTEADRANRLRAPTDHEVALLRMLVTSPPSPHPLMSTDADGMTVQVLVHVVDGLLTELEIFREDSGAVIVPATEARDLVIDPWTTRREIDAAMTRVVDMHMHTGRRSTPSGATVAAIGAVVDAHRELTPILDEHLVDNEGEILPHLVMSDIVRWMAAHVETRTEVCASILNRLDREFDRGPEEIRELIAVSAVEMIPDPGRPGSELREWLGAELRAVDPWLV